MNETQISQREYGHLEAQVAQLTLDVAELTATVKIISDLLIQAKGGWRSVAWIAGTAAAASGTIAWIASHIRYTP